MSSLVSVIIPIYNVAPFIERGLGYIFAQTYPCIEIILVDDGSTDTSPDICDAFNNQYSNVKVIHKENGGAGSARNAGLEVAKGEFIYFFDIDDEAYPNLIAENVRLLKTIGAEMIIFGFDVTDTDHPEVNDHVILPERVVNSSEELKKAFLEIILPTKHGNGFPWNKFYRKSFLDKYGLRYENQRIQQDEVFNLKCYRKAQKVYISPNVYYHYYIYHSSNTGSRYIPDRFEIILSVRKHFEEIRRFWDIHSVAFDQYLNKRFFVGLDNCIRFNLLHKNCPLSLKEKKVYFNDIVSHPFSRSALLFVKSNGGSFSLEQRVFADLMYHNRFHTTITLANIFRYLRSI